MHGLPHDVIALRCDARNLKKLEQGVRLEALRFAKGIDGIYEFQIKGHDPVPIPDGSPEPEVPLVDDGER